MCLLVWLMVESGSDDLICFGFSFFFFFFVFFFWIFFFAFARATQPSFVMNFAIFSFF